MIQCNREIEARRPDIVVVDKEKREVKIIDVAIPGDARVCEKELEKIDKYKPLKDEIARLWKKKKVTIIPVVVGALGAVTNRLAKFIQEIGIEIRLEHVQKTAVLGWDTKSIKIGTWLLRSLVQRPVSSLAAGVRPKSYVVVRMTNRIRQDSLQHHTHLR